MRISIDATPLLLRSAGVKNYVYHWIRSLRAAAGGREIETFPVTQRPGALDHERSQASALATVAGIVRLQFHNYSHLPWTSRADVFHASHQCQNPPRGAHLTTTIYDMTTWLMPELHVARNVVLGRRFGERVMTRADGLIAISEHSRQDALRILRLAPEKVTVVYPGVIDSFFEASPEDAARARARYGLARPYALFVGTIEPRKNVGVTLDAWAGLPGEVRREFDLIVAGSPGWRAGDVLRRLESGEGGVRYLGYVPEPDLPGLTAGAEVFVYPSLYEGFGFPVAQAMAAGAPVVTSNVSSLPEIAGEAARLVDPSSAGDLREAIRDLLLSPSRRDELSRLGRARSQRFRWSVCAQESLRFFDRVVGG
jgi:glycosyltransferase involved in cell wall biosynthesis